LAADADVNAKQVYGMTPLHHAAGKGQKEIVELLIAEGADVNSKNDWVRTPLHNAANEGHKEIAELLISNGADVNAKHIDGGTALDTAILHELSEFAAFLRKTRRQDG